MTSPTRRVLLLVTVLAALVAGWPTSGAGAQPTRCGGRAVTIVASPGQRIVGTPGDDVIVGTPGDDVIVGRGGDDVICGLGGDDLLVGGAGGDILFGQAGDDDLRGGGGRDRMVGGGASGDICIPGRGNDVMQGCSSRGTSADPAAALEARMVDHVNALRASVGVGRLRPMTELSDVARAWSARLPSNFAHNPNVGSQIPAGWRMWGENIGYRIDPSASTEQTLDRVFQMLVESPGHYANMVGSDFTHIGIGVVVIGDGVYVTQVFARY